MVEVGKEWNSLEGGRQGTATDGRQAIGFQVEGPKVEVRIPVPRSKVARGGDGAERVDQLRTSRIPNGIVITTQIHVEKMTGNVVPCCLTSITSTLILNHVDAQDLWCSLTLLATTAANDEFEGGRRWSVTLITPSTSTVTVAVTLLVVGIGGGVPLSAITFPQEELSHFLKDACGSNIGSAIIMAMAVRCCHLTPTSTPWTWMEGSRGLNETSNERHRLLVSPASHGGDEIEHFFLVPFFARRVGWFLIYYL